MKLRFLFISVLVSFAGSVHAINKCVDANGQTVYQEQACAGGSKGKVNLQNAGKLTLDEYEYQRHQASIEEARERKRQEIVERERAKESRIREEESNKYQRMVAEQEQQKRDQQREAAQKIAKASLDAKFAACAGRLQADVLVGMSESDFMCTTAGLIGIEKVNTTTTLGSVKKQFVLGSGSYVYITNGVVTAIQN